MNSGEPIELKRDCEAVEIPSGVARVLPATTLVNILQTLGTGYTIGTGRGYMYRIDVKDSDALGLSPPPTASTAAEEAASGEVFSDQMVWDQLRTVYDPEIPINIVDLGLIYSCLITPREQGGKKIEIKMSMTAPGCGMGDFLKRDVEGKLSRLPEVNEVEVEVVFEPPWHLGLLSEAARLQLGID